MRRYISVDSGKFGTKAVLRGANGEPESEITFLTKCDKEEVGSNDFRLLDDGIYSVEFEGIKYTVGEKDGYDSFNESKAELIHKICTYTAIARLVDNDDVVVLAIGCPLSIFLNKDACTQYVEFMRGKGRTTIKVNDVEKTFVIMSVSAFAEGSGYIYLNFEKCSEEIVGVIDIGGLNTNCCVYDHILPVRSSIFTTRLGGKRMRKALLDQLNSKLMPEVPLPDYLMDDALKKGYVMNRRDPEKEELSRRIIREYRINHVKEIYDSCISHNWALDSMRLVFVGGTSLLLKNEIKEIFGVDDDSFFDDAAFLNARGYLRALA